MLMPDVNVLIYAHRQEEVVHAPYRQWLDALVQGPQPFALSVIVAVAFVRICTNPRIYKVPTPLPVALAVVDQIANHPNCRMVSPDTNHWQLVSQLCRVTNATGKPVADAQHAALAIAEGCTFVTRDSDFAKFANHGLTWKHLRF